MLFRKWGPLLPKFATEGWIFVDFQLFPVSSFFLWPSGVFFYLISSTSLPGMPCYIGVHHHLYNCSSELLFYSCTWSL
jgi:hypothetical protein